MIDIINLILDSDTQSFLVGFATAIGVVGLLNVLFFNYAINGVRPHRSSKT